MTKQWHCPTCNTEIDEHEVGECLDLWVGEDVMGHDYTGKHPERESRWIGRPDRYSKRISPAMQAAEKMRADGWAFEISLSHAGNMVVMWKNPVGDDCEGYDGESLPLALCRAIIKAANPGGGYVRYANPVTSG